MVGVQGGVALQHTLVHNVDHAACVNIAPVYHGGGGASKGPLGIPGQHSEGAEHILWGGEAVCLHSQLHCSELHHQLSHLSRLRSHLGSCFEQLCHPGGAEVA